MTEEKGPHCSLTQTMLEKYLPEAVMKHKNDVKPLYTEIKLRNGIDSYIEDSKK